MLTRILAVTVMNLRGLAARWPAALVVVVCLAGVTGVLVSMLAMAGGFEKAFGLAGRDDRVVVLSAGETTDSASSITRAQAPVLLGLPGLAHRPDGSPRAMLERYTLARLPLLDGSEDNFILRGVGDEVLDVRPEVRLLRGRLFAPGLRELVVGRAIEGRFEGLALGRAVELSGVTWRVVGVFEDGGSAHESEAWADVEAVMTAYNQDSYSALTGTLESRDAFQAFADALASNPQLRHAALREPDYYASQTGMMSTAMRALGYVVAAIMALGALFAAVDTMYASVETRSVEIATLRALGFDAAPIVASVLVECLLLCATGALLGSAAAWWLFNGYSASTLNGLTMSRVAFTFEVSTGLLVQATLLACAVALLGGLYPAIRAVRMPILEALRET